MLSQEHISAATPTGANVVSGGATFRVYAPRAIDVYLLGTFDGRNYSGLTDDRKLVRSDPRGYWTGFQRGAREGDQYRFWVVGTGSSGNKRDPYARELGPASDFPDCASILRAPTTYTWHDTDFRVPDFSEMVIYQAHLATFAATGSGRASTFLDVAAKVPYLASLGINVLQPMPVDEVETRPSMGYGGADLFSPDFPCMADPADLPGHLATLNAILDRKGLPHLTLANITPGPNQLKALIDLCHVHGIAVTLDVVYNHAGGFDVNGVRDYNCLYFFDRMPEGNNKDSLYFINKDHGTGGLAFALGNPEVSQFLLDNAAYYVHEFHADGFRYDEISILLSLNQDDGWNFCRRLTKGLRKLKPRMLQNAEFWPSEFNDIPWGWGPIIAMPISDTEGGTGFDVVQHDALRVAVRSAVGTASAGASASVSMSAIAGALYPPGLDHGWRAVTCVENHDRVYKGREQRVPRLADGTDRWTTNPPGRLSWYARSRSRFATGILLTAAGIPQIFMGQEFLEDRQWSDNPADTANLIGWAGANGGDADMPNHLRFTRDLVALRARLPALRSDRLNAYYNWNDDRVIAFHRWVEWEGRDVIVAATLAEATWWSYNLGFPLPGFWREVFNSDYYDDFPNPRVTGNSGGVWANGGPLHTLPASASVVIPANGIVVFAKDQP